MGVRVKKSGDGEREDTKVVVRLGEGALRGEHDGDINLRYTLTVGQMPTRLKLSGNLLVLSPAYYCTQGRWRSGEKPPEVRRVADLLKKHEEDCHIWI